MKLALILIVTAFAFVSCTTPPRPLDVSDYAEQLANEQAHQIFQSL